MIHSRILSACFICLFMTACNTQGQITAVKKTTEIKTTPDKMTRQETMMTKTDTIKARQALNLSIDSISVDQQRNDDNTFDEDIALKENNSALFETLSRNKVDDEINVSGKLITDENKLANKEYLDSIDGLQINIEGSFN